MPLNLSHTFNTLADLLESGSEPIAQTGAAAFRRHARASVETEQTDIATHSIIRPLLENSNDDPVVSAILPVFDQLSWHYSGYDDGRISADVALHMQTVELIGAHGMIHDDSCRAGLFAQTPNVDYIIRTHAAEELFVQIAGEAEWMKGDEPFALKKPRDRMHHASYQPHASRTKGSAMIAVWVWAGELGYDTYSYAGVSRP